jgi:D-glutamate N-acetyltransferase
VVALNTRGLDDDGAREAIAAVEAETGLAADDPVRFGADRLLTAVLERLASSSA